MNRLILLTTLLLMAVAGDRGDDRPAPRPEEPVHVVAEHRTPVKIELPEKTERLQMLLAVLGFLSPAMMAFVTWFLRSMSLRQAEEAREARADRAKLASESQLTLATVRAALKAANESLALQRGNRPVPPDGPAEDAR